MQESLYPGQYKYRRIVQAKLFIDSHYAENINLGNISDEALFSKFHFVRLFKKTFRKTPHQYLIYVRIEKAKQLLQCGAMIRDACYDSGFDSISSFSGLFKKMVSLSPSAYLRQQLELKKDIAGSPLKYIPNCFAEKKGWTKNSNFKEVE